MMLILGVLISLPAGLLAAFAPSVEVLIAARIVGGLAAGMAYPTTLALITALWSGASRTKAIALWSAVGGAISALGPLISGLLLESFDWGSVFLVTIPLILIAVPLVILLVPSHVNESSESVDNLGGLLSAVMVGGLILAINFAAVPGAGMLVLGLSLVGIAALIGFVIRQRRAGNPLYDLAIAGRRIFWVAACAGIIVFGALMGAMFIGQQYLQNVLGYSTVESGFAILPAAVLMVLAAPISARIVEARGARFTLLLGYAAVMLGFLTMLVLWQGDAPYWVVGLGYAFVGAGVGLAGTPASRSLTGAVPVRRAGMASGTADLQRDLGGAIMQSILGALLTAGYAASVNKLIADSPNADQITASVQSQLTQSFASAENIAQQYPQYADAIVQAAKESFEQGQTWAYLAGLIAVILGAALVAWMFPGAARERELLEQYHREDAAKAADGGGS